MKSAKIGFLLVAILCWTLPSLAEVRYRGYQVGHESMTTEDFQTLTEEHGTNIIRFQLTDINMDDITVSGGEQAYIDMVEGSMDSIEPKANAAAAAGNKIVIGFALPAGGFKDRNSVPPHSKMFSNPTLQEWYIRAIVRVVARFSDLIDSGDVYAIDINSEPADSTNEPNNGADDWNELLVKTIEAARGENANVPLMVKPLYADPTKLTSLPALSYENLIYGYHWYFFNAYQHTGIHSSPFSITRPGKKKINNKTLKTLSKFFKKQSNFFANGLVPAYPPLLAVGEAADSNCAEEAPQFLADMYGIIERDDQVTALSCSSDFKAAKQACKATKKGKKRKRCIAKARKKFKKCKNSGNNGGSSSKKGAAAFEADVQHDSWTHHAYAESKYWDPRYSCSNSGSLTFEGQTATFDVLDDFMDRNN